MVANLLRLFVKKSVRIALLLTALSFCTFWLVEWSPIDPVKAYIGGDMQLVSPEQREQIAVYWGLNRPPMERFLLWGKALLHGDFGTSLIYRKPVLDVIGERFMSSLLLMGLAWMLSGVLGFALGSVAALNRGRWIDRFIKSYCYILASTPVFWLALLLMIVFAAKLGWFPVGLGTPAGVLATEVTWWERLHHVMLPALALSIVGLSTVAMHTRTKLLQVYEQPYILFARANGEKGAGLFWRHGFRHAIVPAVTIQFAAFGEWFGGSLLAEQVFSYPGLGAATVQAGLRGDIPLLLGIVLFSALFVFAGNMLADFIVVGTDPRMKEASK